MAEAYVIPDNAIIKKRANSVTRILEGKAIIVQSGSQRPFQLNEAGTKIWTWMDRPRPKAELLELLQAAYLTEKKDLLSDLDLFLSELYLRNLIITGQ